MPPLRLQLPSQGSSWSWLLTLRPSLLPLQTCAYELMRTPEREELAVERGLWRVWNKQIVIGIIPPRHGFGRWRGRMRGHACPLARGCL